MIHVAAPESFQAAGFRGVTGNAPVDAAFRLAMARAEVHAVLSCLQADSLEYVPASSRWSGASLTEVPERAIRFLAAQVSPVVQPRAAASRRRHVKLAHFSAAERGDESTHSVGR